MVALGELGGLLEVRGAVRSMLLVHAAAEWKREREAARHAWAHDDEANGGGRAAASSAGGRVVSIFGRGSSLRAAGEVWVCGEVGRDCRRRGMPPKSSRPAPSPDHTPDAFR